MKTVLTGGAFDLLHWAHILFLEQCATYGGRLIVLVASDARVKHKKGYERPILSEDARCAMIRSLRCVDGVVCFSGDPEYPDFKAIDLVKPDVLVVNSDEYADYSKEEAYCRERGVELIKVPRIIAPDKMDTGQIIKRILTTNTLRKTE